MIPDRYRHYVQAAKTVKRSGTQALKPKKGKGGSGGSGGILGGLLGGKK